MNKLTIIGNCTKDPELRTTPSGKNVCTFTVAVNRRKKVEGAPETDYFRVTAWDQTGELCAKYLHKGKKVCVVGAVSVYAYKNQKGEPGASLEVVANEIEFISPRDDVDKQSGMQKVQTADNPFDEVPY